MSQGRKVFYLLLSVIAIILLPTISSYLYFNGEYPAGYFDYPPLEAPAKAPLNIPIVVVLTFLFCVWILLYLVPRLFGFKKYTVVEYVDQTKKVKLPIWFWVGLVLWGASIFILWGKFKEPTWFVNWVDLPLFWGFVLVLDGWVFIRKKGNSIIAKHPQEIIGIGVASVSGWLLFEYLNFFVADNWIYPYGDYIPENQFTIYAVLGSSGLLPLAFEWYDLLRTFKFFKYRFSNGIRFSLPMWFKNIVLVVCLISLILVPMVPNILFFMLWVSPLIILAIVLEKMNLWTPFSPIKNGNWTPLLISALAYFIQGFLLEFQNYFSAYHTNGELLTFNPAYWTYSIPYVNIWHVFEMPALGLQGYLPFGTYCLIWWIVFTFLMNIPSKFVDNCAKDDSM